MTGIVDIHCHILPGIDDGPLDMAASIAMARAAVESGISTVAATPHLRADFPKVRVDEIADRCQELRDAIAEEGIELKIVCGAEVSLGWALEADDVAIKMATYAQRGTDILVELPSLGGPMVGRLIQDVRRRGPRVTIAHPERLRQFQIDVGELENIAAEGVSLQVNADSVAIDRRRSRAARLAQDVIRFGTVSVIGSDSHRATAWRAVSTMADARAAAIALVGVERAEWMTEAAPGAILAGHDVPLAPRAASKTHRLALRHRR